METLLRQVFALLNKEIEFGGLLGMKKASRGIWKRWALFHILKPLLEFRILLKLQKRPVVFTRDELLFMHLKFSISSANVPRCYQHTFFSCCGCTNKEFKKLQWLLQRKRHFEI